MLYVYKFNVTVDLYLHVLALDYTAAAVAVSGKVGPVKPVNHTSLVAVVTPTDGLKSVRNSCVIELFLWRCLRSHFALFTFLLVYGLVKGLSQISSTVSLGDQDKFPFRHAFCNIHVWATPSWIGKLSLDFLIRTRQIIRYRAIATLWRPQIKQYTALK